MLRNRIAVAAIAGATLLAAAPAYADSYKRHHGHRSHDRVVVVHKPAPYYGYGQRRVVVQRPMVVQRPVVVQQQPVVVYRQAGSAEVLGGMIFGAVLGAVIASHAGY